MIDQLRLEDALAQYRQRFVPKLWGSEKYKWEAVKWFQDHWDVNAPDFAGMLSRALERTYNLLASTQNYPKQMIVAFAKAAPEEVRGMFIALFDERRDVYQRMSAFKAQAAVLLERYGGGAAQHYQYENAISIYLWLRFPDKYYIYKFNEVKTVARELGADQRFRKGAYADNIRNFLKLYDEISAAVKQDTALTRLFRSQLTDTCYPDPELKTLTIDVGFYISRYYSQRAAAPAVQDGESHAAAPDGIEEAPSQNPIYTREDFLAEVYMTESRYDDVVGVLRSKKNIILQGAPGVGKTFAAKRLAYAMMGQKDEERIELVQFHQSYSYEDFVMGYKPDGDGFKLASGIFYRFCQRAANQPRKDHFFIIDEINRGNMSKIFGELLMLIERDYRGTPATLAYNGARFRVPENLYIIGMMNTADRSLAMIDYALRRRFSFFDMEPGFDTQGFARYQDRLDSDLFNELIARVRDLNRAIAQDRSLGKGFCIGHSYFCGQQVCQEQWLRAVVDYDLLPMLREYWFDDPTTLRHWENVLHGVFQ